MKTLLPILAVSLTGAFILTTTADADDRGKRPETVHARLVGYEEVPSISSPAQGSFRAVIDEEAGMITYTLRYDGIAPAQSHLHLGERHVAGGISVFLCTNLGNAPAGGPAVQACPAAPAEITGVIMAANVTGPANQGITTGEFAELLSAIRAGAVYVNVHSAAFAGGEIRGQLGGRPGGGFDFDHPGH